MAERAFAGYSKIRKDVLAMALNYLRFIEEWGSGLKRVNDVLRDFGVGNVEIEDVGLVVRMNVHRASAPSNEVVNPRIGTEKHSAEVVNEGVSEGVSEGVNVVCPLL